MLLNATHSVRSTALLPTASASQPWTTKRGWSCLTLTQAKKVMKSRILMTLNRFQNLRCICLRCSSSDLWAGVDTAFPRCSKVAGWRNGRVRSGVVAAITLLHVEPLRFIIAHNNYCSHTRTSGYVCGSTLQSAFAHGYTEKDTLFPPSYTFVYSWC